MADKYYQSPETTASFSRVKFYSFFSKLSEITQKTLLHLQSLPSSDQEGSAKAIDTIFECLLCELSLTKCCNDSTDLDIIPISIQILDYLSEFEHVSTLYTTAALHLKKIKLHINDADIYNRLFFGVLPFVKLFGAYNFDIERMHNDLATDQQSFSNSLKENFLKTASEQGRRALTHLTENKQHSIIPKFILDHQDFKAEQHNIREYYSSTSEVLIAHYILSNKLEELLLLTLRLHSFYGTVI